MTADPRSILGHGGNAPPAEAAFRDTNREYSVARTGENQPRPRGERSHLPVPMGDSTAIASHFASRGQSPILPPIRDLQSMSERGVNAPNNTFPESRAPPRSDPFGTQDYRASHPPTLSGPMADPRNLTNSGPPMMHAQALPYGHPQMGYQGDPEQISPQMMTHPQQANFGVMGDSIDPKTKRRRGNLPKPVTDILRAWFLEHVDHPYPSEEEKQMFMTRTGLSINQVRILSFFYCLRFPLTRPYRSAIGSSMRDDDSFLNCGTKCEAAALKWTPNGSLLSATSTRHLNPCRLLILRLGVPRFSST